MHIENEFFRIVDILKTDGNNAVFKIELIAECKVYEGHFPGNPICPGVFNIETIKECAQILSGRSLRISGVKHCRFTSLLTPANREVISVKINTAGMENGLVVQATISDISNSYVEFKGNMIYD